MGGVLKTGAPRCRGACGIALQGYMSGDQDPPSFGVSMLCVVRCRKQFCRNVAAVSVLSCCFVVGVACPCSCSSCSKPA